MSTHGANLLTLSMIVKDEARTIAQTLRSVRPFVDRWEIVDTGSTDDTREIVEREMAGVPGRLSQAPFVDFETTRNFALEQCGTHTEFILWLDADDELARGEALRTHLEKHLDPGASGLDAFLVRVETVVSFDSVRIVRSRAGWRFKGAVHEILTHPTRGAARARVPNAVILHHPDPEAILRSHKRRERDVELLARAVERDPTDARSAFYLAMTYFWLGRYAEAIPALQKRIALGGFREEVFITKLTLAEATEKSGAPWKDALALYLDAYTFAPHRAEPLYHIALHHNAAGEHALCLLFARRALDLPYPDNDQHFVDEEVYTWKIHDLVGTSAYWLGEFQLGENSARLALKHNPKNERLAKNLSFYERRGNAQTAAKKP
ncbi:MAG: glycosyltransferase [Polyangiaceae bacterium]|nr:glycosyltransferase [Polyangiaceae bacterium]